MNNWSQVKVHDSSGWATEFSSNTLTDISEIEQKIIFINETNMLWHLEQNQLV